MGSQEQQNVQEYAGDYGFSDDSSTIIINNLNSAKAPVCKGAVFSQEEAQVQDTRILLLVLDMSPSMAPVAKMLINDFNGVFIPALQGGKADMVGALRIGGIVFDENVTQIWVTEVPDVGGGTKKIAFHPLEGLPSLTHKDYNVDRGYSTALHQAIITAFTATTTYAAEITDETGSNPEITILILSDGANHEKPHDNTDAKKLVTQADRSLFKFGFFGFETGEPVDFRNIGLGLGFRDDEIQEFKQQKGEDQIAREKRFRHFIAVFSQSGSRNMPAGQAAAVVAQGGDDDGYFSL